MYCAAISSRRAVSGSPPRAVARGGTVRTLGYVGGGETLAKRKLLVACVLAVVATSLASTSAEAAAPAPETIQMQRQAFNVWKAWDCTLAVAAFAVGNGIVFLRVKKAGVS